MQSKEKRFHEVHTNYLWCDRRSKISFTERRMKYVAVNSEKKQIAAFHTDTDNTYNKESKKSDYAIYVFDQQNYKLDDDRIIFIELKGSDIEYAIKQIDANITNWLQVHNIKPKRVDARVVASKVRSPRYYRSDETNLKVRLRRYGNGEGTFDVEVKQMVENV